MSDPSLGGASGALPGGTTFHGRYRIVRCINAGGMGAVYESVHVKTGKHRALKVMLPQVLVHPGMRERFELEAPATADIDSDHTVETFDAGIDEQSGAPFLVMELLREKDLDVLLREGGPLTPEEAVVLFSQAALALDKTHAANIVHRDLKPQNLFVRTRDDGSPCLKVLGFGIAKVVTESDTTKALTATRWCSTATRSTARTSLDDVRRGRPERPPRRLYAGDTRDDARRCLRHRRRRDVDLLDEREPVNEAHPQVRRREQGSGRPTRA